METPTDITINKQKDVVESNDIEKVTTENEKSVSFKKPLLIGKIGKFPRKIVTANVSKPKVEVLDNSSVEKISTEPPKEKDLKKSSSQQISENPITLPYKEPVWSGLPQSPNKKYAFEILKSGAIIGNVDLMEKSFWVFGRLPSCDIPMAHPTISRYHAILQYRSEANADEPQGFYLYDLSSTHGTFLNKNKLKSRVYARVQVGHMIKLGCSSRTYILTGPEEDTEEVSELSVTELKQKRAEELLQREIAEREAKIKAEEEEAERKRKEEERGIDWGMGEDADEETDLAENPYAQTNNEELYLEDPKKALRGFMEREGLDLEYDCSEQGMGQFLCKVELPIDDDKGRPIVAEVLHKGKKKEAVVQCALEACRILDRHGLLRQATHESRKRKAKNWEENDFYDSDDDTFFDRTGSVEKKRENRMKAKLPQQAETYQSLFEKEKQIAEEISSIEAQLENTNNKNSAKNNENEDSLDSFMKELKHSKLDKQKIIQLKSSLHKLKLEHANIVRLVNIARPADLPPLVVNYNQPNTTSETTKNKLPIFGKRIKVKVQKPVHTSEHDIQQGNSSDDDEEEEEVYNKILEYYKKLEAEFKILCNNFSNEQSKILKAIWTDLKNVITEEENHKFEECYEINKIGDIVINLKAKSSNVIGAELNSLLKVFKENGKEGFQQIIKRLIKFSKLILDEEKTEEVVTEESKNIDSKKDSGDEMDVEESIEELERKRKKNQRRIQQRQVKSEIDKQKGYEEDAKKEDYNMWVPPSNQTGDGRTTLNEKFGY